MVKKQAGQTPADLIAQLKASEERYQAFIKNSNEGIWRFELDEPIPISLPAKKQINLMFKHGYLAEANEAMARMYGLTSAKDILGARLNDFLIEDDPENIAYLKAFVESNYSLSGAESHEMDRAGNRKYFLNGLVGFVENGKLVRAWGTQRDITERRMATEALKKSEERLALAFKASKMGTWEWDLTTGKLTWSKELRKIFGLKPTDEISHEKYLSLLHPDDAPMVKKVLEKAMKDGKPYTIEDRIIWPNGSVHWLQRHGQAILKDGKPTRMVGISMNIDKRKKYEIGIQESEQRFRTMADAAPVLIWVAGIDKLVTYYNQPWYNFTGRKPKQDLGDGWQEVIHPDDLEYIKSVYFTAFDEHKPYRAEYRVRRYDGKYLWMLDKGAPRYTREGEFLGYVGSMIEVEEIRSTKKRQQELEEINLKLKQQQKQLVALNNSKDEFISVASHQLRTPATGVKQYIGMLLEGYAGKPSEAQFKMLQTAYESNERQLRIIDDLLKVAHVDAGKVSLSRSKTDLIDLMDDIIDEQADKFKHKRQGMSFKHADKQVFAMIDPERMRMVIENLIDNASKYTPEGKNVTVELEQTPEEITIRVSDQGIGIAKKDIPQLFHKFSRLNNVLSTLVGGTGLGLYWVKKIVILHKGTISVESQPDQGSKFTITIPRNLHEKQA